MGYSYQNTIDYAREEGEKRGREIGRAEGEKNKAVDIARNMLADGLDVDFISRYTGLSLSDVRALQS